MTAESARPLDIWRLRIERHRQESVLVLVLTGRIGMASAGALRDAFEDILSQGCTRVVVDLVGIDYISSAGLVVLDDASGRLASSHGCLVLCGMGNAVSIAFALAAPSSPLVIEQDCGAAVQTASTLPKETRDY